MVKTGVKGMPQVKYNMIRWLSIVFRALEMTVIRLVSKVASAILRYNIELPASRFAA